MTADTTNTTTTSSSQIKPEPDNMADQRASGQTLTQSADSKPNGSAQNGQKSSASNAKDPLRPRRKKAKRACFACQRAHLTCGDERPCQRCIKRGLQDACHDGVRKKAKYLHDAPNEALVPGIRGNPYNQPNAQRSHLSLPRNGTNTPKSAHPDQPTTFFPQQPPLQQQQQQQQNQNNGFENYPHTQPDRPISHGQLQENTVQPGAAFNSESPVSPTFTMPTNPNMPSSIPQASPGVAPPTPTQNQNKFNSTFFDPSDPALFNFDLASMNFGNHYGALEFGMLGHMATGAGDTPPSDSATQHGSISHGSAQFPAPGTAPSNFGESPNAQTSFLFEQPPMGDWGAGNRNLYGHRTNSQNMGISDMPNAFAIESAPANFASPSSAESPLLTSSVTFDDTTSNPPPFNGRSSLGAQRQQQQQEQRPVVSTPQLRHHGLHIDKKRRYRNPSVIYDSVREPYSYTSGFHSLTACIQRRFSPQNTLRIAKALASIRPSFIATTKTLNRDDLVFMEKCFQRTLWEYEDFINACGTPTIVCRRTGEIAAVGKEFSILTGWKKEVLLGKEPNQNINTGGTVGSMQGVGSRGQYPFGAQRTQPVFLAELLDDDSVIEFYEDFARLAFGDSRGSVMTTCKLLKYKTKEDMDVVGENKDASTSSTAANNNGNGNGNGAQQQQQQQHRQRLQHSRRWSRGGIADEAGMNQLGFRDGKVECSYCWTVKRDVFDIPMLIVMNFLPCI